VERASEERQWVSQALRDPESFRRLYARYFPRLYAYASARLERVEDVQDVVAEVFGKVVETLGDFEWRHDRSFAAWLFRLARNVLADHYRRRARHPSGRLDDLQEVPAAAAPLDDRLVREEEFARLRSLLATLAPRRQEVIRLKFYGDLRNHEIARVLILDERTVAAHLSRGIRDMYRRYRADPGAVRGQGEPCDAPIERNEPVASRG
jgi:RNA polymerase sigma-70 factor (ECF subfamily)